MYFCQIPSIPQIEQIVTTITEEEECKQSRRGLNTSCEDFFKCFQKTMVDEDFCLKWNDHHSVFFSVAQELLQQVLILQVSSFVTNCCDNDLFCREPWLMWPWPLASPPSLHIALSSPSAPPSSAASSQHEIRLLLRATSSTSRMSLQSTWKCCSHTCTGGRSTVQRVNWSDFLQPPGRLLFFFSPNPGYVCLLDIATYIFAGV